MAIDSEGIGREGANLENEDIDMQPGSPKQLCTPDAKNSNNDGTPVSSQKDCRPALIPSKEVASLSKPYGTSPLPKEAASPVDESQQKTGLKHNGCPSHNPALPTERTDVHASDNRTENTDPITFTPPSQRYCRNDANHAVSSTNGQSGSALSVLKNTDQAKDAAKSLENAKGKGKGKQSQKPAAAKHRDESLIHAAFKRSATASANDETQICIDITGGNDEQDLGGTPEAVSDINEDQRKSHSQYATPFLNASEKWFPALKADLQCILAHRAQQIAIRCTHHPSINAALYLLSKGPWIPTHISVHVRQAALAAVGTGWSWGNQIPTIFPFGPYDACLSLATLDDTPPDQTEPIDALFLLYQALCKNLSQETRNFLFSRLTRGYL